MEITTKAAIIMKIQERKRGMQSIMRRINPQIIKMKKLKSHRNSRIKTKRVILI